jgi:hypothetical protein
LGQAMPGTEGPHTQAAAPPGVKPLPPMSFFAVVARFTRIPQNALLWRTLNHQGQYRCSPDAHSRKPTGSNP